MSSILRGTKLIEFATPSISYDRQVQAGCTAFDKQMYEIEDDTPVVIFISRILELADSNLIDILAWQFHVDFYDATKPLAFRRQLVFNSIMWHKRKGTIDLLQEVLDTYWPGGATIQEWYEYKDPLPPNFPQNDVDEWRADFIPSQVQISQDRFQIHDPQTMDGEKCFFVLTGVSLPAPLVAGTTYYVVQRTINGFKVSTTSGGAPMNLTTAGEGQNEIWHKGELTGTWHDRYRFRALIDVSIIRPEDEAEVLRLINAYKPVSRWFEGFFSAVVSSCDIAWYGVMLEFFYLTSEAPDYTPLPPPEP